MSNPKFHVGGTFEGDLNGKLINKGKNSLLNSVVGQTDVQVGIKVNAKKRGDKSIIVNSEKNEAKNVRVENGAGPSHDVRVGSAVYVGQKTDGINTTNYGAVTLVRTVRGKITNSMNYNGSIPQHVQTNGEVHYGDVTRVNDVKGDVVFHSNVYIYGN